MALGNFQYIALKKEATKGTTVKPDKFIKFDASTLNTKINMSAIKQAEGTVFTPGQLLPAKIENAGNIDMFVDRENLAYMLNMMTDTPTPTNNGDGTYSHSFNVMTGYNSPSYTVEISKDGWTQRHNGVQASGISLSIDNDALKASCEFMGLKSITNVKVLATAANSITVSAEDSMLFAAGDKIVKSGEASLGTPSLAVATVASVNTTTGVITVGTGEGTPYSVLVAGSTGITLQKATPSYTAGLKTFGWYSKAKILVNGTEIFVDKPTVDMKNANDGRFLSGSNSARKIRQGERNLEVGFEVDSQYADALLFAYMNSDTITLSVTFESFETIGSGTRKASYVFTGTAQIKEAPIDIKVSEFEVIPFKADFLSGVTCTATTTIASF